jgi:hypothetical protein
MKTSSIVLLIIGLLLIHIQYGAYKGNNFQIPAFRIGDDFLSSLIVNGGQIIGFNSFGLLGLILIIIAMTRKSKLK